MFAGRYKSTLKNPHRYLIIDPFKMVLKTSNEMQILEKHFTVKFISVK